MLSVPAGRLENMGFYGLPDCTSGKTLEAPYLKPQCLTSIKARVDPVGQFNKDSLKLFFVFGLHNQVVLASWEKLETFSIAPSMRIESRQLSVGWSTITNFPLFLRFRVARIRLNRGRTVTSIIFPEFGGCRRRCVHGTSLRSWNFIERTDHPRNRLSITCSLRLAAQGTSVLMPHGTVRQ